MSTRDLSLLGLALAAALFVVVNLFAAPALRGFRADLTEQKLYTLSDGTRNILGDLEEPITLRFFFSKSLCADIPPLLQYAERVQEMLEEYVAAAGGKLDLEVIDPEPYSEEEELAVGYGIQGSPNQDGDTIYFGLVGSNSVDDEELLPTLDPRREAYLEYELTEMIDKLENPELPVVGLISALPLRGGNQPAAQPGQPPQQMPPWPILDVIQRRYEIRDLPPATLTEIPDDVDLLLLIHPKDLTPDGVYAIDQFCMAGGKVVAFVDAYSFFDPARQSNDPMAQLNSMSDSGIDPLLLSWGVALEPSKIVGDEAHGLAVNAADGRQVRIPVAFDVTADTLDDEDILVSALKQLRMFMPGSVRKSDDAPEGVEVTVLATTSAEGGGTVDPMSLLGGLDPQTVIDLFVADAGAIPLAVRVRGNIRSAFPDGPPNKEETSDTEPGSEEDSEENTDAEAVDDPAADGGHLNESNAPFNAVVFADADMLHDQVWARPMRDLFGGIRYVPQADNAALLVSALENLSGSNDLISLRSRAEYQRPFTRKDDLLADAQERFRSKEVELEDKLKETEQRLNELQKEKDPASALLLSPEQEKELAKFREQQVDTRRSLRQVKRDLRSEIDALGTRLKVLNIVALPLLIGLLALIYFVRSGATGGSKS